MEPRTPDDEEMTNSLVSAAAGGDLDALQALLNLHRDRLRKMVSIRLDPRLSRRIDASDIVQEALAIAAHELGKYADEKPLPFYPWLRRLTLDRIDEANRRHIRSAKQSVGHEIDMNVLRVEASDGSLASLLEAGGTSPSGRLEREESLAQVRESLGKLAAKDREILVMHYLEGMSFREIAAVLSIGEGAARVRHFRALERIGRLVGGDGESSR